MGKEAKKRKFTDLKKLTADQAKAEIKALEAELAESAWPLEELDKQMKELREQYNALEATRGPARWRIGDLNRHLDTLKIQAELDALPFKFGDIVADELGVRYRVIECRLSNGGYDRHGNVVEGGRPLVYGIRLSARGIETSKDSYRINSPNLTKVEITNE